MNKFFLLLLLWPAIVVGQRNEGFEFGKISQADLSVNTYDKDTSAMAVVLGEFGEAYIDNDDDHNLLLEYHIKIKILKKGGVEKANFAIPLYKQGATKQTINSVKASTFNLNGNVVTESKMEYFQRTGMSIGTFINSRCPMCKPAASLR